MNTYDQIRDYHKQHGDDYGSEHARFAKYDAIYELMLKLSPHGSMTVLDVGCGDHRFRNYINRTGTDNPAWAGWQYTGIDLQTGTNVLDYHTHHDIVVANGILYKLPGIDELHQIITHMWNITDEALIITSLRAPASDEEFFIEPNLMIELTRTLTNNYTLRADYLPTDYTIALYK